jgi:hypothetical protein
MASFEVLQGREVSIPGSQESAGWSLCFQWGRYHLDNGGRETGYRFIWRRPDNSLQARPPVIQTAAMLFELLRRASEAGWFATCEHDHHQVAA